MIRRTGKLSIWLFALVLVVITTSEALGSTPRDHSDTPHPLLNNQYGFLDFWEAHKGAKLFGEPLTGIVFEANVPVQYFESARLERRNEQVVVGDLGRERTRWRTFPPAPASPRNAEETRLVLGEHTISGPFLRFWREHEGEVLFGDPLSEPVWEPVDGASIRVQYFARARLEHHPALGPEREIKVSALGREVALAKGLITPEQKPAVQVTEALTVAQPGAAFGQLVPTPTAVPPTPVPPTPVVAAKPPAKPTAKPATKPAATGKGKIIDVDLSKQQLVALENGKVVFSAPVATGKDGFNTPTGNYAIYAKLVKQTMRGRLNGESWVVPNVPHVMYFNGSVALHGAYWHNLFGTGQRLSHGCVNLPLDSAAWLYDWAPVGTKVVVHY